MTTYSREKLSLIAGALAEGALAPFEWSGSPSTSFVYTLAKLHDPETKRRNYAACTELLKDGRLLDLFLRPILIERPDLESKLGKPGMVVSNGFTDDFECVQIIMALAKRHNNFDGLDVQACFDLLFPAIREWILGPDGTGQCYSGMNMMAVMQKTESGTVPSILDHERNMDDSSQVALTNGVMMMILGCIQYDNWTNLVHALSHMFNPHPTARFCALFMAKLGRLCVENDFGLRTEKRFHFVNRGVRNALVFAETELGDYLDVFTLDNACGAPVSPQDVACYLAEFSAGKDMSFLNSMRDDEKEIKMPCVHFVFIVCDALRRATSFQHLLEIIVTHCEDSYAWDTDSMGQLAGALYVHLLSHTEEFIDNVGQDTVDAVASFDPCDTAALQQRLDTIDPADLDPSDFMVENGISATLGSLLHWKEGKRVDVAPRAMKSGYVSSLAALHNE